MATDTTAAYHTTSSSVPASDGVSGIANPDSLAQDAGMLPRERQPTRRSHAVNDAMTGTRMKNAGVNHHGGGTAR